ncbi:hypothetical protein COCCADRAFT_112655 [Bipolaris zeicola 26-R-13]|uniref:Uncharacterized protein n=1 Tax=Cochliobolus carbonum (strain 26-R-13) TaxID=930089 RepID=W6XJ05_COCC2|nr:uncharacterized protein COCCADRAFT_112655 [Bipolaris zeicola 26-R-13]EUC27072.1 hypothetical protein COCCADRAFT_112655 [Bipolaris zeicola 26-R-13]
MSEHQPTKRVRLVEHQPSNGGLSQSVSQETALTCLKSLTLPIPSSYNHALGNPKGNFQGKAFQQHGKSWITLFSIEYELSIRRRGISAIDWTSKKLPEVRDDTAILEIIERLLNAA